MIKPQFILIILPFVLLTSFDKTPYFKNDEPGLEQAAGRWVMNPEDSRIDFKIGAIWILKVKGAMSGLAGEIHIAETLENSSVTLSLKPQTIHTGNEERDNHLRSVDFFDVEKYPAISFHAPLIIERNAALRYIARGELTIKDVTRKLGVYFDFDGIEKTEQGERALFSGQVEINRRDYNINFTGRGVNDIATISFKIVAEKVD